MKKVYIEDSSSSYNLLFQQAGFTLVYAPEAADLIVFTGGEDVTPALYGATAHRYTYNNPKRDEKEQAVFEWALLNNKPMVGICRGGQFLNVMSGGAMYQDVHGHGQPHEIIDRRTGETILVTSTHHQMMLPQGKFELVASSFLGGAREWYDQEIFKRDMSDEDIEVVYYPLTKSLCFQPHPELYQSYNVFNPMRTYFFKLVKEFLLKETRVEQPA